MIKLIDMREKKKELTFEDLDIRETFDMEGQICMKIYHHYESMLPNYISLGNFKKGYTGNKTIVERCDVEMHIKNSNRKQLETNNTNK
jgi:hypothetical protein